MLRAQRRPGRSPRRHLRMASLSLIWPDCYAQRRPGRSPRRHAERASYDPIRVRLGPLNEGRGVHPGDTPACAARNREACSDDCAQRRPGRSPRRHPLVSSARRGTGAARHAQRRPGRSPRRHTPADCTERCSRGRSSLNEGRGVHPGDTLLPDPPCRRSSRSSLNEGRGVHPGDTMAVGR